ncbi:hypothetical protein SAMN04488688_111176 [Paenibacillus sp. cl141a]|nr:hypothetical protein SAMN04488688_111176 [Paenibacillus sp. cl141a]
MGLGNMAVQKRDVGAASLFRFLISLAIVAKTGRKFSPSSKAA